MTLTKTQIFLCLAMLFSGSLNTISKKAQNDCSAKGIPFPSVNGTSTEHEFNHPWFQTLIMFIGEMTCLLGFAYSRYKDRKIKANELIASLESSSAINSSSLLSPQSKLCQWIFAVPTIFDLIGTSLAGIGLLYVDASIWQMLRGSIILFTGILSKLFLKRKLKPLQWSGMLITIIGLILVGLSSVLRQGKQNGSNSIIGIIFILSGQLVSAFQMIIEEIFLKRRNLVPLQVVGMEGFFGVIFMTFIVLPAMYFIPGNQVGNHYENSLDALYQLKNDSKLLIFSLLYLVSIAFYNYFGLAVTKSLTAVHRTLIDACRTIVVWIAGLSIYYLISEHFGEAFDKTYGVFQIDGFLLLIIGTAVYNEIMDIPCIPALRRSQGETYPSLIDEHAASENITSPKELLSTVSETSPLLQDNS